MEKIINGQLNSDKTLVITQDCSLLQGENLSAVLKIALPTEYAQCVFQLEFDCPNNYSYTTPMLTVTKDTTDYLLYELESCILQYSGVVKVQVLVRPSGTDDTLWKSVLNSTSVLEVLPSVNATSQSYAKQDFFAQAFNTMQTIEQGEQSLQELQSKVNAVEQSCNNFLADYQSKLDSGELRGQDGAKVVSIVESGKDLDGNSIYTISMSDGGQFNFTVPAGKQGEKGDKGDKGDTGLTGEYITMVFFKQTLENGDREYIIGTNLGNEFSFISPKGTNGIDGETITAVNHTSTDSEGNMSYAITTNTGKEFTFTVPRGKQGEQGIQGEKGEKGDTPLLEGTHESLTAGRAIADSQGNNIESTYATKGSTNRPNLIINSNFKINQRAKSSYTDNDYTVDRWKKTQGSGTITPRAEGGISVVGSATVVQIFDNTLSLDTTYALSLSVDGIVYQGTGNTITINFGKGTAQLTTSQVSIQCSSSATVEWVKLEIGKYATTYQAPCHIDELKKCQYYYRRISSTGGTKYLGVGFMQNSTSFRPIFEGIKMRTKPTVSYGGEFQYFANGYTLTTADNNITVQDINDDILTLNATLSTPFNTQRGTAMFWSFNSGVCYLEFDAEI